MDPEGLRELLTLLGPVTVRRMFGGEANLKAGAGTRQVFAAAGSTPFAYERRGEPGLLKHWGGLGLAAARRAPAKKRRPR